MTELTEAERARIAETRHRFYECMPELVPAVRELVECGLIDGWRNVAYVGPPREIRGVTSDIYLDNSRADKEARERNGTPADATE